MITLFLAVWGASSTLLLVLLTRNHLNLLEKVEEIRGALEAASEPLEEVHESLISKSKLEVFSDDQVVRDLVEDMFRARDSVGRVRDVLNASVDFLEDEDAEDEEKKIENDQNQKD